LRDPRARARVAEVVRHVDGLRRAFVARLRDGGVRPCGCGQASCPVFMVRPSVAAELDRIRRRVLAAFRAAAGHSSASPANSGSS
ncbi:hypothetical protein SAMN02745194_05100, partial [Roseomonas rosea]